MTLGEKLARLRKEYNYTQEQLADILGVTRQSISKWESDIAYPETDKLIKIGKLFDCSMDYLLKDEITEKSNESGAFCKIRKKVLSDESKGKYKRILKVVGIAFAVILAADVVSMIIYLGFFGLPR